MRAGDLSTVKEDYASTPAFRATIQIAGVMMPTRTTNPHFEL